MMPVFNHRLELGRAQRLPATRAKHKKVLAVVLFVMALFGTRAFAEEKLLIGYSFAALRTESVLALYLLDLKVSNIQLASAGVSPATLLDGDSGHSLSAMRRFTALPLEVFRRGVPRFSKFEPGIGSYFPDDTIGRSRTSGAGLEENRWIFFKFKFRF